MILLFTDGACSGNPGPGGWACILRDDVGGFETELSGGDPETTNNRMELQAVIEGLQSLDEPQPVRVITDSTYVAKGSQEWLPNWKANGWKRKEGGRLKSVKNEALWRTLDALLQKHDVAFELVKGHAGHPENERADQLAVAASLQFKDEVQA